MAAVMPYARHRLSGAAPLWSEGGFVSIAPDQFSIIGWNCAAAGGVEPLQLKLDDAELADWCVASIACGSTTESLT